MKKISNMMKKIIAVTIIIINLSTVAFAAWWGTPGYEWCFSKGITSVMTQNQMSQVVSQEDFYAILLRYLRYKNVDTGRNVIQTEGNTSTINAAILGMMKDINEYITKDYLTVEEYRRAITYIEHAENNVSNQQNLLKKDEVKSFYLFLSIAKYKAATLINNTSFKINEIAKYGNVKYADILDYGIQPYYGNITRKEFLVLMFSLLSDQNVSQDGILNQFNESGILIGYENDLMLQKEMTYSEMFTFLYRFEVFDFNPSVDDED